MFYVCKQIYRHSRNSLSLIVFSNLRSHCLRCLHLVVDVSSPRLPYSKYEYYKNNLGLSINTPNTKFDALNFNSTITKF